MSTAFKSKLDAWLSAVLEAGWLAALVLTPLFFNVFSSRVFEPDKISLLRTIALIMLVAWLTKVANSGDLWLPPYSPSATPADGFEEAQTESPSWLSRFLHTPFLLPILLLVIAYLISTAFSVAPFVSWWGSYQRLQGTYTFLSYVVIALITMGHLRQPIQVRRLQHAVILTSLPIAIYGIVQHYGIDPLPWGGDVQTRVAANAGNAIFLGAYLIMAFFFTLERVYSSFAYLLGQKPDAEDEQDMPTALAGGAYLFVLMVQALALFWTQSRGPWLGWMLGLYLFVLLLFTALRPKRYRMWTAIWVSLGVAGALILVATNTLPVFSGLRDVPHIGRLTTLLESGGGTGRVRVLIWQGAEQMVRPHGPLVYPDGSLDSVNALRPFVGYGPEAMWIAYNPFYPPELAQLEARNASPDRAHNETWDALVITGLLGFLAYLTLFITIFYWALRWMGLLVNKRDSILYGGLLLACSLAFVLVFYWYDGSWRFFGVALPAGMMLGLGAYVTLAAFLHPTRGTDQADLPRQLLLITLVATLAAHFTEIHFGIAIAATRTYFWVYTALLLVLGMRWAEPEPYAASTADSTAAQEASQAGAAHSHDKSRRRKRQPSLPADRSARNGPSSVPTTVMTDVLIFLTLVFIYTTNTRHVSQVLDILFGSITRRSLDGEFPRSPAILFLILFTWFVAATIGLAAEALHHRRASGIGWWLRGYGLHALIIAGVWFAYGLYEAFRMLPSQAGANLDSQLAQVTGHFAAFTWIGIVWFLAAATFYAWPWIKDRRLPAATHAVAGIVTGVAVSIVAFFVVSSVNIALVRADTIYKQGQQFDAQRNWISSVELYRRALNARRTEDHYMLFLGRALLEQAKQAPAEGTVALGQDAHLDEVLALTLEDIAQMGRNDLMSAAEIVLKQAQRVNPLNTDHTANLARLYRAWSDVSDAQAQRQELLDRSIAAYDMAVQLSPNAAHLWNEKGNAHLARGERALAEEAYLHSLSLDDRYDQTYLLLSDFYERDEEYEKAVELLRQGIEKRPQSAQLQSFLGVAAARQGNLTEAVDANLAVIELQPRNAGAMRNLALLYRDLGQVDTAITWAEQSLDNTDPDRIDETVAAHKLAAQLYQIDGNIEDAIAHYEQVRSLNPADADTLGVLANLYLSKQDLTSAVDTLRLLSELEPTRYEHPFAIAQILQQAGQPNDALTFAQEALALADSEQRTEVEQLIDAIRGGG